MKFLSNLSLIFFAVLFLSSCRRTPEQLTATTDNLAISYGFEKVYVKSAPFILNSYQKIRNPNGDYVFYIEGDGLAFTRGSISKNPTPTTNQFLKLALEDHHNNVIYLARPCQYVPVELNEPCRNNKYWTSDRFSQESVTSIYNAIMSISHNHKFDIVGFSGGGAIATLISSEHPEKIGSLVTVAGNLDHIAFNDYHNVPHMLGSLNPIDFTDKLTGVRQLHLCGSRDDRVPCFIAEKFNKKISSDSSEVIIIKGASHNDGWSHIWKKVLKWMDEKNSKYGK
jgi:pimeloyl-ACP methyl ester carboxylesterase